MDIRSLLKWHSQTILPDAVVVADAASSWRYGVLWDREWIQWQWYPEWLPLNIMAKELAPTVMGCAVWSPRLSKKNVLFPCDNSSVIVSINNGSARQNVVMHLLHNMWFLQLIMTCMCQQLTYRGSNSYCRLYFPGVIHYLSSL